MINLLPPDTQEMYRFAHRNTQLRRWLFAGVLALAGLAVISGAGVLYMRQIASGYDKQITAAEQSLSSQKQAATDKQAKDISGSVKLAVQVLSKEILFSDLLKQLAAVTPDNVALSNLNISQVKGALDITASSVNYDGATQLQVNLADPRNKIFSKADIVNISCTAKTETTEGTASKYPCTVTIRALFAPDNPFLFTNSQAVSQKAKP